MHMHVKRLHAGHHLEKCRGGAMYRVGVPTYLLRGGRWQGVANTPLVAT